MPGLSTGLQWLVAVALLALAWTLKDPHLLPVRAFGLPALLVLGAWGIALALRRRQVFLLLALTAAIGVALAGEIAFRYRKHAVLSAPSYVAVELGHRFIVGYDSIDELQPLVAKGLVGGIFVSQRNAEGKSARTLAAEIAHLQALRSWAGLPLLIVATDQEGGAVSRLSPPLERMPPLAALLAEEDVERKAEAYGARQGEGLARLGVTVNFSPVVDLKVDRGAQPLDFRSRIAERAISADPRLAAVVAAAYVRGLEKSQVRATLKHFPGLGGVTADTHHFSAVLDTPLAELRRREWLPFRQVASRSAALLMLSHVIVADVDKENPASLSRAVVQTVIRGEWRHDGVLVTDDLTMAAAYRRGICQATVQALNAGVDLILISYDYEKYYEAMYCAVKALRTGRLDATMLEASRRRLRPLDKVAHADRAREALERTVP